jgi:periplasmic copper chaperone A
MGGNGRGVTIIMQVTSLVEGGGSGVWGVDPVAGGPVWHTFASVWGRSFLKAAAIAWACLGLLVSVAGAQAPGLVAQDAWVRATPGTDMAAAYLTLRNVSTNPITVTGVQSPVAGMAMIHETKIQGGQSQMRPHEQLVVAPGKTVKLEPGGLHVMLHDLKQPLMVGQNVPLVITLAGGGTLQVTAAVRPLTAE